MEDGLCGGVKVAGKLPAQASRPKGALDVFEKRTGGPGVKRKIPFLDPPAKVSPPIRERGGAPTLHNGGGSTYSRKEVFNPQSRGVRPGAS